MACYLRSGTGRPTRSHLPDGVTGLRRLRGFPSEFMNELPAVASEGLVPSLTTAQSTEAETVGDLQSGVPYPHVE